MADSGIIIGFFRSLSTYAVKSNTLNAINKIYRFAADCFKGCFLCRTAEKIGCTRLCKDESVFYRILNAAKDSILFVLDKIYTAAHSGVVFKAASFLLRESKIFKCAIFTKEGATILMNKIAIFKRYFG